MKEGLEANEYLEEISNELEKICFNIITYSDVPTYQPICELKMLTNASGQEIQLHDKLILREELRILTSQEAGREIRALSIISAYPRSFHEALLVTRLEFVRLC